MGAMSMLLTLPEVVPDIYANAASFHRGEGSVRFLPDRQLLSYVNFKGAVLELAYK